MEGFTIKKFLVLPLMLMLITILSFLPQYVTAAASYTFSTIDFPNATFTFTNGINDHGKIVGDYQDTAGKTHGYLLSSGTFSTIDCPGAVSTMATGVNNNGQILGECYDAAGKVHGFLAK